MYPEEVIGLAFFVLLLALSMKFNTPIEGPTVMVRAVINVILIILALSILSGTVDLTLVKIIRNWAPIVFILIAYENLGNLVRFINPHDADPVLKQIDEFMFGGVNPTLWLEHYIRPWFSEIMHMCYVNYYPFLPVLGFFLYMGKDYHKFRNVMVSVTLGFYLGYIGYMLVPTVGPRYFMAEMFAIDVRGTTMFSEKVYQMLVDLESTRRDCFPSLHTAITVIVTTYAFKYRRTLFWFLLPVATGIVMATMYLRYHYVIDVIAGLFLAAFCVWAGPRVNAFWYKHVSGDRVHKDYPERLLFFDKVKQLYTFIKTKLSG
jgi:membrane-associated phospholipid phosphatase